MPHIDHKNEINKLHRTEKPRNELKGAFAGNENNGEARKMKSSQHSTNVKSRQSKMSRAKEPIR